MEHEAPAEIVVTTMDLIVTSSPAIGDLATALAAAQGQIEDAEKDSANPHFKSRYASLAAVRKVAREPLAKNGLALLQFPTTNMASKSVLITTMVTHTSGQFIRSTLELPVPQWTPQGMGSAISYGRRYSIMAVLNMAAEDDDAELAQKQRQMANRAEVSPAQAAKIVPANSVDQLIGDIGEAKDLAALNAITNNKANIKLFNEASDEEADQVAAAIEVRKQQLTAPAKTPAKATKAPAEKTPAAESGHAQAPVYDDEASREASAKMVSDLAEIAQLVAGEEPEPGAAKVELTKWAAKHSREKAMLIPEDKAIVTKSFVDLQTKIREVAHALEKAGE